MKEIDFDGYVIDYDCLDTEEEPKPVIRPYNKTNYNAWASFILGIVGSLGWLIPIIGLPVTIAGTVLGAVGMKKRNSRGIAIAGMVINIVFLLAAVAKGIVEIVQCAKKNR